MKIVLPFAIALLLVPPDSSASDSRKPGKPVCEQFIHTSQTKFISPPDFLDVYCKELQGPILECLKERPDFEPGVEGLFKGAQNTEEWKGWTNIEINILPACFLSVDTIMVY